jgi:hypothetical protein
LLRVRNRFIRCASSGRGVPGFRVGRTDPGSGCDSDFKAVDFQRPEPSAEPWDQRQPGDTAVPDPLARLLHPLGDWWRAGHRQAATRQRPRHHPVSGGDMRACDRWRRYPLDPRSPPRAAGETHTAVEHRGSRVRCGHPRTVRLHGRAWHQTLEHRDLIHAALSLVAALRTRFDFAECRVVPTEHSVACGTVILGERRCATRHEVIRESIRAIRLGNDK